MSKDDKDRKFEELMQNYESDEVDWDDVEVPDFDDNDDDTVLDLNIDTEINNEDSLEGERYDRTRFHELKQAAENSEDDPFIDKSQDNNQSNDSSDPFIYVDENELVSSKERNQERTSGKKNTQNKNDKFDEHSLVNSSLTRYSVEYIIMEWLQYLVDESSVTDAYIALNYYCEINWLSQRQKDDIQEYLHGFSGEINKNRSEDLHTCKLTNDHHRESLKYVNALKSNLTERTLISRIYP